MKNINSPKHFQINVQSLMNFTPAEVRVTTFVRLSTSRTEPTVQSKGEVALGNAIAMMVMRGTLKATAFLLISVVSMKSFISWCSELSQFYYLTNPV
jgi:hypothetical protein